MSVDNLPEVPEFAASWDPNIPWYMDMLSNHEGQGVITQYGGNSLTNPAAFEFMESQYLRFGMHPPCPHMLEWCWNFAFYCIDQIDPYIFFHGLTDVIKTDEPMYYQFSVRENEAQPFSEVSGEEAEMYRLWPKGRESFDILMEHPGLQDYFEMFHDYMVDHLTMVHQCMNEYHYNEEVELIHKYGDKMHDYAHLGIWAAVMWMVSYEPEAKMWRFNHHPIFQLCYEGHSCLLNGWRFYPSELFKMEERPLFSCKTCGIQDWCVELTQISRDEGAYYICQHCLSDGVPFAGRVCGTTACTQLECKNHPFHEKRNSLTGDQAKRQIEADARYGSLRQLPNGMKARELPGIVRINTEIMDKYSRSIADDMGKMLTSLLSPPK